MYEQAGEAAGCTSRQLRLQNEQETSKDMCISNTIRLTFMYICPFPFRCRCFWTCKFGRRGCRLYEQAAEAAGGTIRQKRLKIVRAGRRGCRLYEQAAEAVGCTSRQMRLQAVRAGRRGCRMYE
jgi:hypothetical protein